MKKNLLLLISFVLAGTTMARQLTPEQALTLAMSKLNAAQPERARALAAGTKTANVKLTHTETTGQDVPLFYVYNIAKGGFIIASADDRVSSLLGYIDSGDFDSAKQNESFMAWLESCSMALSHIENMPEQTRSAANGTRALTTAVRPLLGEIEWNQKAPYNLLTPMREGKSDEDAEPETIHAPTGCVATAIAQVMMYHQWPVTGTGIHTNQFDDTQTINFSQSTYQWSKMLPFYNGNESEESKMAVAQLMKDVGCAVDMKYDYSSGSSSDEKVFRALTNHFGYDKSMRLLNRYECSSEEWNNLLQTELNEKRPVLFSAMTPSWGGHEFVIDGYDINGLYHVNWGWGGQSNGYFDMNVMAPYYQGIGGFAGGYTIEQTMVIGVKPDVTGTSVAKPELVMTKHFLYDTDEQEWSYNVSNLGVGDFTGETGLAMESPTGEVTKVTSYRCDEKPIPFYATYTYSFGEPEVQSLGYKLYPYYCDVIGGEIKPITVLYNGFCTLQSVEVDGVYTWDYDEEEVPDVQVDNVEIKHNFVGFVPQLNITLSNPITSTKEYTEDIIVEIYKITGGEELYVCKGIGQAFIMPGESQEIAVRCSAVEQEFEGKIDEGEYRYYLHIGMGRTRYQVNTATFEMVIIPPSEITYSDFSLNKTEYLMGEELTASMKVTNTGGYDMKTLMFVIALDGEHSPLDMVVLQNIDIEEGCDKIITFKKVLSYNPGNYFGAFFENGNQLEDVPSIDFAITAPTAIREVVTTPANDRKESIYDLQGRPVKQMRKGGLYISKGKTVVAE